MSHMRIALIGYGSWVRNAYLPALRRDGRVVVVSAAARSDATRQRVISELGDEVAVFDDYKKLMAESEPDAVMIAVPDVFHERILTDVLDSGAPVFYEPPVSDKRENIVPMLKRLLSAPQITHADTELCYIPVVDHAADYVRKGLLGEVQSAEIRLQSSWGPKPGFEISNINHMSTWYVDIFNTILGKTPRRVMMFDGHGVDGYRQSHSSAYYDYDGVWGHIKANIASVVKLDIKVEFNGDDGDMILDLVSGGLRFRTRSTPDWTVEEWPAIKPYADFPGMHESVAAFLDAVESGRPTRNSASAIAGLHMVGLAADNSRDSGTWADVEDIGAL